MESSPAPARMKQVVAKLSHVPALLAAARANISHPPRPFVERGIVMFRGAADLLAHDLQLAFAGVSDAALQAELSSAAAAAERAVRAYANELQSVVLPAADGQYMPSAPPPSKRGIARRN